MTPRDTPWDLFVSYAHRDAAAGPLTELVALIREIQRGLDAARPWHVFFDTDAIRVLDDWEERIGGGLRTAGVMLALVSPAYFASEWCRREWAAFREQEQRRGEPRDRLGVLYLETDPTFDRADPACDWRRDLKRRQYLDLRGWADLDAAARHELLRGLVHRVHGRLEALLSGEARRLGAPYQFPQLPPHYVARPAEEQTLQGHLLGDGPEGGVVVSAVFGQGGIGKSTLVSAVVRKPAVLDRFPDGVLWATLGQEPEPLKLLGDWIRSLGDHEFKAVDVRAASGRLRQLLYEKAALLVVDDAWRVEEVEPFRVGGPLCRMVVTTRRARVADDLAAERQELDVLTPDQAVALLVARLQRPLHPEEHLPAARLADTLGRLPLALELAAVRIGRGTLWDDLQAALDQEIASLEALEDPAARRKGGAKLAASFNLSLRALRATDEAAWQAFIWLGVLPEDVLLTAPMARTLWDLPTEAEADNLLESLWGEALLQSAPPRRVAGREWRSYRVHDLLHDHARRLLTVDRHLADAHRHLVARYRTRARDGAWHRLPDDGYIHGWLGWHLEHAGDVPGLHGLLREETADGRNGWFEANQRLGQPANFLAEVARAGRLSLPAGMRFRYVLVLASLNSRADNVSGEVLATLVGRGIWPVEQALVLARQKPSTADRASALMLLLPFVPESNRGPIQHEAFRAAVSIQDEAVRSSVLVGLAPHLPGELLGDALRAAVSLVGESERRRTLAALGPRLPACFLGDALRAAASIRDGHERFNALAGLAPCLPDVLLGVALQAASAIGDPSWRSEALAALAPHLPARLHEIALTATLAIRDVGDRCRALAAVVALLPPGQRTEVLMHALRAALAVVDGFDRCWALAALIPHLPESQRSHTLAEAIRTALAIDAAYERCLALAELSPHLPPDQRTEPLTSAVQALAAISDSAEMNHAIGRLAPHLPGELLGDVVRAAAAIDDEYSRQDALGSLAPHLPEELFGDALRAVASINKGGCSVTGSYTSYGLIALAPYLPGALLGDGIRAAEAITYDPDRSLALVALAQRLPSDRCAEVLGRAVQAAYTIRDGGSRSSALTALVPHLPPGLRERVLARALRIGHPTGYAGLVPHLPEELLGDAFRAASAIADEAVRGKALAALVSRLPADLVGDGLRAALSIRDASARYSVLGPLAIWLPPELAVEAFRAAASDRTGLPPDHAQGEPADDASDDEPWSLSKAFADFVVPHKRAIALVILVQLLPEEQLAAALPAIIAIADPKVRSDALASLAARLPAALLSKAVQAAAGINDEEERGRALRSLAPHLSGELLGDALRVAAAIGDESERASVLGALAPHLSAGLLGDAVWVAAAITDGFWCHDALTSLTPHLPVELLADALLAAADIGDEGHRASALGALAPRLPAVLLADALSAASAISDPSARYAALAALAPHHPPGRREEVLSRAVQAASAIDSGRHRFTALLALAPRLPPGRREEALACALQAATLAEGADRRTCLAALAPHLPGELLGDALRAAADIGDEGERSKALAALAPHLPADLLRACLQVAATIGSDYSRRDALAGLAPHLPADLLADALPIAFTISSSTARCGALLAIALRLPPGRREEALSRAVQTAAGVEDCYRPDALAALAPHISTEQSGEALRAAEAIRSEISRGKALAALVPHLPVPLLAEAFQAAVAIGHASARSDALPSFLARLAHFGRVDLALWYPRLVASLETGTRPSALAVVPGLIPIIAALAGDDAPAELAEVADAILDVGRWWP